MAELSGLIVKIQLGCLDDTVPVETLLRQVKLAAAKLGLGELESWVDCELNGYPDDNVPDYRILRGQVRAWNPYHGWVPVEFTADIPQVACLLT